MKIYKTAGEDEPGGMNVFARLQRWHCPNCGEIAAGYHNKSNITRVECKRCHITMLRKQKGRHHDIIEIFENISEY